MAGFCKNCGNPLGDGQGFCVKCGTRVGEASQPAAAAPGITAAAPPPPTYTAPPPPTYAAPAPYVPPVKSGTSPLIKILIAVVIIFVVFGAFAAAAMIYIGHRVHEKAQELGLTQSPEERSAGRAAMRRLDACGLLSKADVSQAVKLEVVRAEPGEGDTVGCTYTVMGDGADLTAKHVTAMHKNEMSKSQQDSLESFAKTIFQGNGSGPSSTLSDHPGEAPVFTFSVDNSAAELQMRLNKATLSRLGPSISPDIPNLGDEAFDAAGAMLFVRKGDKVVRIMYMTCPCTLEDILPLARKIAAGL
jgi:hypothetical protein